MVSTMEYYSDEVDVYQKVNSSCEFIDLENHVCRYVEAGLRPGRYTDSICSSCLAGLDDLKSGRGQ